MRRTSTTGDWIHDSTTLRHDGPSLSSDHFDFMAPAPQESAFDIARLKNPSKVGIGTWDIDSHATAFGDLDDLNFGWYTNWSPTPLWSADRSSLADARFVPMIWGRDDLTASTIRDLKATESGYLLGFNEPDNKDQSDLTVREAVKLWSKLTKTGLEIGSPACTTAGTLGDDSWLGRFMARVEKKDLDVDFVAVHYYSDDPSIAAFKSFLQQVHKAYDRPVWVTEWALVDWNDQDRFDAQEIADFAEAGTRMMDQLNFIKRHSWFGAYDGGDGWHIDTQLFDADGDLTAVGKAFEDLML